MTDLWTWAWCRLGRPRCHRVNLGGVHYAICDYCKRQSEVHEFGGPPPLFGPDDDEPLEEHPWDNQR